jgi:hypothetical protein
MKFATVLKNSGLRYNTNMVERISVLRDIAKELVIPIANTCSELDIQHIILQEKVMEDRGDDDCFGYLFQGDDSNCSSCEIKEYCERICKTEPPQDDESMKGVLWVNPNLTSFGFNRGSQGHAVVELLLKKPRTTDEIKAFLISEFQSTDERAQQMWNYIKERLKQNGYTVQVDTKTKLNTLIDKTVTELDRKVEQLERKGKTSVGHV